ncbi:MAG: asparagine synthase (glutamine-hydrolyzing), partial [Myxococcota bacterium]
MCGLIAVFEQGAERLAAKHGETVAKALLSLAHRGPDGTGLWVGQRAVLGHRRLAIVDPAGGAQPFVQSKTAWVANAEIYNHADLGPGAADCGVLGAGWQAFGDALPEQLDGQFAFAIVDDATGHWLVARDPAGICPLYVGHHEDGTIWFASEMKALVDHCAQIALVEPGHAWTFDGREVRTWRWFQHDYLDSVPTARPDAQTIRDVVTEAVRKRFMADVPFGVLLSGGLDSGLVAASAMRLIRSGAVDYEGPLHTFAIGLEGGPDLAPARRLAAFLGTEHHEFTFTVKEALEAVPAVVRHLESYQQIRTAVPTYLLAERVRKLGFKMVLSGEGADELLGGYLYFHHAPSPEEFHAETLRKTFRLHQFDVMRANKAPMAHGLELRFPLLDRAFIDLSLGTDPAARMPAAGPSGVAIEKAWLRAAFDTPLDPWLPDDILWRQKEQFSDGVGYDWVDELGEYSKARLSTAQWARREEQFP